MLDSAGATAGFTRRADHLAHASTRAAGARNREEALLKTDLAGALTGPASLSFRARCGARAITSFATFKLRNAQLGSHSGSRLLQLYFHIVPQIRAALCRQATRTTAAACCEHITKAKKITEDVFDTTETRRAPGSARGAARHTGMAEAIVTLSLFGVRQHGVSFGGLFKSPFRGWIGLVFVRMILMSEAAIGCL